MPAATTCVRCMSGFKFWHLHCIMYLRLGINARPIAHPPCRRKTELAAMSRQSPTGFLFSIVFEIAIVVAIVSFLPRVDLRPLGEASGAVMPQAAIAQALPVNSAITPVGWTDDARNSPQPPSHETSYYQRPAAPPTAESAVATPGPMRHPPPL